MASEKNTKSFRLSKEGTFKISESELRNQIDNYNTLSITKSYRGIATVLILAAVGITAILYFVNFTDLTTLAFAAIIYLPLAYFIYKGKKWAMIAAMIMWTIDKGYQMFVSPNLLIIIWWLAFMTYFYKAYKIEVERNKIHGKPKL